MSRRQPLIRKSEVGNTLNMNRRSQACSLGYTAGGGGGIYCGDAICTARDSRAPYSLRTLRGFPALIEAAWQLSLPTGFVGICTAMQYA